MGNEELSLSIVLPTYNRVDRLRKSLAAYLKCARQDVEFIIVDNASTDATANFVNEHSKVDSRIRYVKNPVNIGANRSVFRGFMEAKAPLVMILADDDLATPGFIETVIDIFENHPKVGVVHSYMDENSRRYAIKSDSDVKKIHTAGVAALNEIYISSALMPGITFRQEAIDYKDWTLDDSIYPQVRVACNIAMKWDVAMLTSETEYITVGKEDDVLERSKTRPDDYGILERIDILDSISTRLPANERRFLYYRKCEILFRWGITCISLMKKLDKEKAIRFKKSLVTDKRLATNIYFIWLMIKNGDLSPLLYIFNSLFYTSFWDSVAFYSYRVLNKLLSRKDMLLNECLEKK